jgi:hypothetical protein
VAAWLAVAFEEGRLNLAEFDRRTEATYAAVSRGELARLVDDLPIPEDAQLAPRPAPAAAPADAAKAGPAGRSSNATAPWLLVTILLVVGMCMARTGVVWPIALLVIAIPVVGIVRWVFDDPFGRRGSRD